MRLSVFGSSVLLPCTNRELAPMGIYIFVVHPLTRIPLNSLLPPMQICNISQNAFLQPPENKPKNFLKTLYSLHCVLDWQWIIGYLCLRWNHWNLNFCWIFRAPNSEKQLIYLVRANVFVWWRWVCQSEECRWCRPPTPNLSKERKSCIKLCEFVYICICKEKKCDWYEHSYSALGLLALCLQRIFFCDSNAMRKCIASLHNKMQKIVVQNVPEWGLYLVIDGGWIT